MSDPVRSLSSAFSNLGVAIQEQLRQLALQSRISNLYSPLEHDDDVRLIHLMPGAFDDALDISLVSYASSERPDYEALSYVWGDSTSQKKVVVNGEFFTIGSNLEVALRYLRKDDESRTLWVDAICINQHNNLERNQQVGRMREIYADAQHTILWMGEEGDHSDRVFDALEAMNRDEEPNRAGVLLRYFRSDKGTLSDLGYLMGFTRRPWWQRMWVLQEAVVSKSSTVQCGRRSIPWLSFEYVSEGLNAQTLLLKSMISSGTIDRRINISNHIATIKALRQRQRQGESLDILSLVVKYRANKVTDPRDKIFALHGLSTVAERNVLRADYRKSIAQVYIEFAKFVIETRKSLDVLAFRDMHRKISGLPSWVPDWSCSCHIDHELPLSYDILNVEAGGRRLPYQASGSKKADVKFSDDMRSMTTKGITVCHVQILGKGGSQEQRPEGDPTPSGYALPIQEIIRFAEQATNLETSEMRQSALLRVLVADRMPTGGEPTMRDWQDYLNLLQKSSDGRLWTMNHLVPDFEKRTTDSTAADLLNAISRTMRNRRLFISDGGHLGLAPSRVKEGDLISVLFGGSTPYVLRAYEEHFHLVGEAYIWHPQLMNGQVVDQELIQTMPFRLV